MEKVASEVVAQEIRDSWQRCLKNGMSRKIKELETLSQEKFNSTVNANEQLIKVFKSVLSDVINLLDNKLLFFLTDKEGILLKFYCIKGLIKDISGCNISKGVSFREDDIGTNAISLAMALKGGVSFSPDDHYCDIFNNWYCYAAPIYKYNQVIAFLDISTINEKLEKELIVIADLLISLISKELNNTLDCNLEEKDIISNKMSSKQLEILKLLSCGKTEKAAAAEIGISVNTVKYHKKKIYSILKTNNLPSAIMRAVKTGLINIGDLKMK